MSNKEVIVLEDNMIGWKKRFFTLWTGEAISIFTSSVIQMAIIWYLTDKTKSAAILSLATLVGFLPQAILGPFIGVLVDRYNRKNIMIFSDLFIALMTMVLVVAGIFGELPIWLIMIVLFTRSIGNTFYEPSMRAITPTMVPAQNLTQCAGYSQTFESVSMLFSPAIAALAYSFWNINWILMLDVAGAVIAVAAIMIVKIPKLYKQETTEPTGMIKEAKEGIRELRKEKGLMSLMIISAVYAMIYFPIGTLYPLISMTYFGGTFQDSSIVEIVFAAGTLLGAVVLSRIGEKLDKIAAIRNSIGVMGFGLVITGLLPPGGFNIFVVLAGIMGITIPFYYGVLMAIFQIKIRPEYLGRVISLSTSLAMVAMPLGLVMAGTFAELIGVEKWFFFSGIGTVIIALFCFFMPSLRKCCGGAGYIV